MKKNRIIFCVFFFLSIIFIFNYGGMVPYVIFHIAIALPLLSFLFTLIAFYHFRYIQAMDKTQVVKGDTINYTAAIYNSDIFLYPFIKIKFYGDSTLFKKQVDEKRFSLSPFKRKEYAFQLLCKYRGYYEVGIEYIEFTDFLGILRLKYSIKENKPICVRPKIIYIDNLNIRTNCLSEVNTDISDKFKDTTTISDIRKFVLGDTFKMVHWKLTAKTNQLMVKNFQGTTDLSTVLVLDLKKNQYSYEQNIIIEDKLIESIIAVVRYCLANWIPINLVFYKNGIEDIEAKNLLDFERIYNLLSEIRFNQNVAVNDLIDVYQKNNINNTSIMIFTSNVDYDLCDWANRTRLSGFELSLFYVSPSEATETKDKEADSIMAYLPEIGVNSYKININDDIKAVIGRRASQAV
ncbi:MAG: DUF58 domain-containing protein [Bacillota bacterium]|nr:DUF58 domain-containing protein [Bacillota bacterium]